MTTRAGAGRAALVGSGVALVEAVLLLGYGVYLAVESVVADATERPAAIVLAVFCIGLGAGLAVLARALRGGRRWARSPLLLWQALQATVAVPALRPAPLAGAGLLALSVVAAAAILFLARAEPGGDAGR